jgi:hypothetical protein
MSMIEMVGIGLFKNRSRQRKRLNRTWRENGLTGLPEQLVFQTNERFPKPDKQPFCCGEDGAT